MHWEDERYVRLYVRDTTSWVLGPWEARAVMGPVMRKLDRAGTLDLGADGIEGLAALALMPLEVVQVGMAWWLKRGTFELRGGRLVMPNFLSAQEAAASDAKRARELRARRRDGLVTGDTKRDAEVTRRDEVVTDRDVSVTSGHEPSRPVTPYCAVPSRAVPTVPDPPVVPRGGSTGGKGSRISEDWSPSEATLQRFRERERVDAQGSLERFRNHFLAATGRHGVKSDWDRTFVNWVLEDIQRGRAVPLPEQRKANVELFGAPRASIDTAERDDPGATDEFESAMRELDGKVQRDGEILAAKGRP